MAGRSRAQSEVIGIVLLTAVIVVLVSVAGAIVLSERFEEDDDPLVSVESNATVDRVRIDHTGGDSLAAADVEVVVRDGNDTRRITLSDFDTTPGTRFEAGSEWETSVTLDPGEVTLIVVHTPSETVLHEETYAVE